jgi:cytochrome c-type biogenesis protein CcmE
VELTPRTLDDPSDPSSSGLTSRPRRSPWPFVALALVVVAIGFVVWQGLNNATLYFYNADEAVAKREELGDRRFRMQGSVAEDAVHEGDGVRFAIEFDDVRVDVHHAGDPEELFRVGIPVVLEGRWGTGDVFESDEMVVKHSAEYKAEDDYDERVREADQGGREGTEP